MVRLLVADIIDGLRRVRRNPRLTWLSAGTLALGIGAATFVLTMAHMVLLAPPPFRDPDRLVYLRGHTPGWTMGVSEPDLADYRRETGLVDAATFANYAEFSWTAQSLAGFDGSEVLRGLLVTDEYFRVFDQPMALGRGFAPDEGRPGREAVVISHSLWQRRFGARPDVVGSTLTLDGRLHTVVGVAGRQFLTYEQYEVAAWVAFRPSPDRRSHQYDCFARLNPGVTVAQAQRQFDAASAGLARAYPDSNKDYSLSIQPLLADLHKEARPAFLLLVGAVTCLLLIAAANVTCLLLARASTEAGETAVRAALGASRLQLFRAAIAESLALAGIAGTGGALIGAALIRGTRALMPESLQFGWAFVIDSRVLVAAFLVSALGGVMSGLVPAADAVRVASGGSGPSSTGTGCCARSLQRRWHCRCFCPLRRACS